MVAAAARLLLAAACLASAHEAQDVPIPPRTGLWAPRAQPKPRPKPALLRKRSNLWSHMFEPTISTPFSKDEHAALTAPNLGRAPPAPRAAAPTRPPVMAHVATVPPPLLLPPPKPFEELYPPPKVDPALMDPALAPPAQPPPPPPPPLALARTDAHFEARAATVEEDADIEASEEALEVSDPILAKLDKINAALHAMRHPVDERAPHVDPFSARLGAAQLHQHVQKTLLPPAPQTPRLLPRQLPSIPQVPASKPAAPAPAAAPAAARSPPVPTIAPGTPLPGAFVAPPEPMEARPQLSMLRKQQSAHGLFNRLFDDSPAPTRPPRKKVAAVLSLARVIGAVKRSAPIRWADHARKERSLAAAYS